MKTDDFIRSVNKRETENLLNWLMSKGIRLGICSNNNEFWYIRQMRKSGLFKFFSPNRITLSCKAGINKTDLRIFHLAADSLGLHPIECAYVDDRLPNVENAMKIGMTGIYFPSESPIGAPYLYSILKQMIE